MSAARFDTDVTGLSEAVATRVVDLADGEEFPLRIAPVAKRIGVDRVRMLAYGGSVPGPTLRVLEGSRVAVRVLNESDLETTVHWHGVRLDNRYDGTHLTQDAIPVGGSFRYELEFPDPGVYWYHPHVREDYAQELGLYGNIIVSPRDSEYWPSVHREVTVTLDDVLVEDGAIAAFRVDEPTHVAMGRFGNVMLVAGESDLRLDATSGEVVRLYLTNTANTRVFNVALPGARLKLVGGDSGHYEHEAFVEDVLIAPSERMVVDVLFEEPGEYVLEHRTPARTYRLADFAVGAEPADPPLVGAYGELRTNQDLVQERMRLAPYLDTEPDKVLAFVAEMDDLEAPSGHAVYTCPMHPDVVSGEPGKCPQCGMKLLATAADPTGYACPMHPSVRSDAPDRCPECGMKLVPAQLVETDAMATAPSDQADGHGATHHHGGPQGIEWEDDMLEVNRLTTPSNMRWQLVDRATGAVNSEIQWTLRVGDRVKIRLVNELDSDHPMPHPFHIHGAGRFLVLARDGAEDENLVWKDTVLVRTGETVDILFDVTHPGRWMAHCHIAEHHESGMMFAFDVLPAAGSNPAPGAPAGDEEMP